MRKRNSNYIAPQKIISIMERALLSEKGIRLHYDTRNAAISVRNQMGKARQRAGELLSEISGLLPGQPGYGQSQYHDLTFTIEPVLDNVNVEVEFLLQASAETTGSRTSLLRSLARALGRSSIAQLSERDFLRPINNQQLQTMLSICSLTMTRPLEGGEISVFRVERAPTFALAWEAAIRVLPAWLYIHNSPKEKEIDCENLT